MINVLQLQRLSIENILAPHHHVFLRLYLEWNPSSIVLPFGRSFIELSKIVTKNIIHVGNATDDEYKALVNSNYCRLDPINWQRR
jgi:hypothetical protein